MPLAQTWSHRVLVSAACLALVVLPALVTLLAVVCLASVRLAQPAELERRLAALT